MSSMRGMKVLLILVFCVLLASPVVADPTTDEKSSTAASLAVADLDWIIGDWRGEKKDSVVEESWSAPGGGVMMGTFRWFTADSVRLYEFMLIEPSDDSLVLRLKHFSPGLVGWEEKADSMAFYPKEIRPGRALFEMDPEIEKTQLVYTASDEGKRLKVELIKTSDDGSSRTTTFEFQRQ